MATDEEVQHAQRLLEIHKRNLSRLEERKALLAGELNVGLENQIAQEQADIAALLPLVTPPPSKKVQEFVTSTSGGPPGEIDLMMLYLQGTQINTRMTQAEGQAREEWEKQTTQNRHIIDQQARDTVWRMQTKEVIDQVVAQVAASEKARRVGAKWYRRALVIGFGMSVLALIVSLAALAAVR